MPTAEARASKSKLIAALEDARARELRAAQLYRLLGDRQSDSHRRDLFYQLAAEEEKHARQFGERIVANGGAVSAAASGLGPLDRLLARTLGTEAMLERMEAEEERNMAAFDAQAAAIDTDPDTRRLFEEVEREEQAHARLLQSMSGPPSHHSVSGRLEALLRGERWHVNTGTWIGDAIYGMNDGLTAVFGIVTGMAGLTRGHADRGWLVIGAGSMAMLASAISMGASAFLAAKAEREVYDAEIERERREIEESPDHEKEELALIYQLKGLSEEDARRMADTIAGRPEAFLRTMAHEELGLSDRNFASPWSSMGTAALSTGLGGLVPVLPFFVSHGVTALVASAVISTMAHFAVGAAKTLVTARNWFLSGLEMTVVGVGTGLVLFVLGNVFRIG